MPLKLQIVPFPQTFGIHRSLLFTCISRASTALFASLLPQKRSNYVQLIQTSNGFPKAFSGLAGAVNKPFPAFPSGLARSKGGNMESRKKRSQFRIFHLEPRASWRFAYGRPWTAAGKGWREKSSMVLTWNDETSCSSSLYRNSGFPACKVGSESLGLRL